MAEVIPDLWRTGDDAAQLYQLYLLRLQTNLLHERVVAVCPRIRRYAARGPGAEAGLFTFGFEIDSLCDLHDCRAAWRRLRLRETVLFGHRRDHRRPNWAPADFHDLAFSYVPLLFFMKRYRRGCKLLETALGIGIGKVPSSYDLLFHVYNEDPFPAHRCRVTLSHFYERLGRRLDQWQHWDAFVDGFHPRLFRLSGIRQDELRAAPDLLLPEFFNRLLAERDMRTTSGVTFDQDDLIESPAKVAQRQEKTRRQREAFNERIAPAQEWTEQRLLELFPELRGLPKFP